VVYIGQALEIPSISKIVVAEASSGKAGNAIILKETKKTPPT
jgi:hypothetical protein